MADAVRETILDALYTCLAGVTTANGHPITVNEVRRGIHLPEEMPNRPALGYTNTKATRVEGDFANSMRVLDVLIYGYVDVQPGNYDNLDDLMQGVEQRLMTASAWTYKSGTNIKSYTIYEAGAHDPIGYFDMEVEITYFHARATP